MTQSEANQKRNGTSTRQECRRVKGIPQNLSYLSYFAIILMIPLTLLGEFSEHRSAARSVNLPSKRLKSEATMFLQESHGPDLSEWQAKVARTPTTSLSLSHRQRVAVAWPC